MLSVQVVSHRSPIADIVHRDPVVVDATMTVAEATRLMEEQRVSSLLLRDVAGIVTERDVARALVAGYPPDGPVGDVASAHPLVVDGRTSVVDACTTMITEEVRHLVVDVDGDVVGVVSLRDIAAVLLQSASPELWLTSLRIAVPSPENWLG